jgi:hypothetical protein
MPSVIECPGRGGVSLMGAAVDGPVDDFATVARSEGVV